MLQTSPFEIQPIRRFNEEKNACLSSSDVLWPFGYYYNNMLMTYVVVVIRASTILQDSECQSVSIGSVCTNTLHYELLTLKAF